MGQIKEHLQLKNNYTNKEDRISFSFEVIKCNKEYDDSCKSDEEIDIVLQQIYFTFFILDNNVVLANPDKIGYNPITTHERFYSQFKLQLGSYRDNNNFYNYNKVTTNDNKWWPFGKSRQYQFINLGE